MSEPRKWTWRRVILLAVIITVHLGVAVLLYHLTLYAWDTAEDAIEAKQ